MTFPDGGHRTRTGSSGTKVPRAAITPGRKCTDGFEPSLAVLQTVMTSRSCARRKWTVFELNELLRIFSPPLLPSQLTVHDHPSRSRTCISALRGRYPGLLDDGAMSSSSGDRTRISALKGPRPDRLDYRAIYVFEWAARDSNPDLTD